VGGQARLEGGKVRNTNRQVSHNRTGSKPPGNVAGVKAGVPGTHSSRGRGEGRGPKGSIGIDDADPVPTVAIPT
jgi:hypothetical protein